ncbi:MAG: LysR family transcriptional regulator [Acidobacteriia bacterium]|nr:LysR family transcriptional regulator [Methyloceanibacter sp.]MBX5471378.1 LysR family transcriptional regulator [Acetobacteraceae bacterium]MCL6490251.1 LysR family transcriptional regulator [Terriglobia bacterium]
MTLEQLRIFVAVAEREHVTRAAEALHLTQSAVSAAIQALERRHDTRLFDRVGRNVVLTEAGRVFLAEARAVLARAEAAELALAELAGLKRGRLLVQASQTIAAYWLPQHLVRFRQSWPGVELRVRVGNTAAVARAVAAGEVELGFVEGSVDDTLLRTIPLTSDRLLLVAAPSHPWAGRESLGVQELAEAAWVMREPGSGTRSELEEALQKAGLAPAALTVVLELPANEAVRRAVELGAGVAALSEHVLADSLASGRLVRLPYALPARAYSVVRHRERRLSRAAQALLDLIAERPELPELVGALSHKAS